MDVLCVPTSTVPLMGLFSRMGIPAELRPLMGRTREVKLSLGTRGGETAKPLIHPHASFFNR